MTFSTTLSGDDAWAPEEGTKVFDVDFYDEDDTPVAPNELTKTLTDLNGNIINSIDDVVVGGLASSMTFVLQGNDLAIPVAGMVGRVFTLEGTYDSSLGTDMPLKVEIIFKIKEMVGVT